METADRSVTPIVANAAFEPSATLVAVITTTPAEAVAVNVTALPEVLVVGENDPPAFEDHVTPWFAVSLVSVAVKECVCDTVRPPRFGVMLTVMLDPLDDKVVAEAVFEKLPRLPMASVARTR